jgi:hypothetical protein
MRQVNVGFDVAYERIQLALRGDLVFGALALSEDTLCFLLIAPEVRLRDFFFESF